MAERKWTEEQKAAISTKDRTLLVSAAAGSGKTATLTERIISSVLDEENPISIADMLIVTFTNAAVNELRDRIGKAVKAAAADNPDNLRLQKELLSMKDAKIMTIDSFCNRIVKLSPGQVGLPLNYRIGEGAEMALLRSELLEGMIYSAYEGDLPFAEAKDFAALAECLTDTRGERGLYEIFNMLYQNAESSDMGVELYRHLAEDFNPLGFTAPENSKFGKYITQKTKELAEGYLKLYELRFSFEHGSAAEQKAYPLFEADAIMLKTLLGAQSYADMKAILDSHTFDSLYGGKGERCSEYQELKEMRGMLSKELARLRERYFSYEADMWLPLYSGLYEKLSLIYRFLHGFDELYSKEKRKRGVCTYSDLEKYALSLLLCDGLPTALAAEIRESYKQIYIDEYQDVNKLQGLIFDAISKEDNRFMVGDIKQSIYGFRAARPEIFAGMKDSFPKLGCEGDFPAASLFMSNNFRCDKPIIDFINGIFDKMFTYFASSIGYVEDDRLKFSKIYEETDTPCGIPPEIHIVAKDKRGSAGDGEDEDGASMPALVAKKVKELLDGGIKNNGKPITPSDIAIIIRSDAGKAVSYADALESLGIKALIPDTRDFFLNSEILLTLSLLHSIDNPRKDIYLSSLMCSPLFGFTADELLEIRQSSKREALYEALLDYAEATEADSPARKFISTLLKYRKLAEGISVDRLLSILYRETGLMALAAKSGGRDNLILLHNYARQYEAGSFKGLYSFISYVNSIIENGERAQFSEIEGAKDSVRIITAHKSKGLEFPVCFLAGAGSAIEKQNRTRIAMNSDFGMSIQLKDDTGLAIVENPVFHAINSYNADEDFKEELRVLYVALTRARERLYVYGAITAASCDKILEKCALKRQHLSPFMARRLGSYLEIILATHDTGEVICHEAAEDGKKADEKNAAEDTAEQSSASSNADLQAGKKAEPQEKPPLPKHRQDELSRLAAELAERFNFKYPHVFDSALPEKLSVSKLYPAILDEGMSEAEQIADVSEAQEDFRPTIPEFISGRPADESAKRGIATHMLMQFCDLERLGSCGAKAELERLVKERFLSQKDGERVRLSEIDAFCKSSLFAEMKRAKKLYRELRFNLRLPAEEFTENPEAKAAYAGKTVLTQGVIDCLIEDESGNLHLVDYKTDRLTKEELEAPTLGEARLRAAHQRQLGYYKRAVFEMFGKEPVRVGIYSLHLGYEIEL